MPETEDIFDALKKAEELLRQSGMEDAATEALFMVASACGERPSVLLTIRDRKLKDSSKELLKGWLERRILREPLQYILGETEFYGYPIKVTPDVLIPRPETEEIVDEALKALKGVKNPIVLDLCAGSGCIAIAIAKEIHGSCVIAIDASPKALAIAEENAVLNNVEKSITFLEGDLFASLKASGFEFSFDLIASNPPYIKTGDIETLPPEVRLHEPRMALDGGTDGLFSIRRIIFDAPKYLKPGGTLLMEIGFGEAEDVKRIVSDTGLYEFFEIKKDLEGIDRILKAVRKS
ncbi:MAG: peptide chain release factor N(5)-glutamine methyltransferase [Deltaproteobacteria bacterium]